ncbi:MAG TPA: molybdopterin dinucleotide binding domain-containing protein, partial [Acidimicrobiales bacterium]
YRRGPARDPRQRPDAPPGEGHDADGGPDGRLALVAVRPLFAGGTLVERSRSLGALAPPPVARLHPDDAAARDLAPGDRARIATPAGAVELPVSVDERIVPGTVVVPVGGEVAVGALLQAGEAAAAAVVTREEAR